MIEQVKRRAIPIKVAKEIGERYGYDQVVIYGRRVSDDENGGEHLTTWGRNRQHCKIAALMSEILQKFMGWNNAKRFDDNGKEKR